MLATIRNPFLTQVVSDPWTRAEGDVPQIHQPVFELCHDLVEEVAHGAGSTCLLIYGEAGSGKTHLLSKLRAHLEQHSEAVFISVRLQTVAPRIWRHIRRALAVDLLRETAPDATRLDGLLQRMGTAEEMKQKIGLAYGLATVLTNFRENRYRTYCAAWLRGESLPDSIIEKLGLAGEETEELSLEDQSNQTVLHLCRMLAPLPVVFCFDQVEALETVPGDLDGLHAFGKAVVDLHAELANLTAISSMQSSFAVRLEEKLDRYIFDRLSLHRAELHPLSWRQGLEVLRKRLDSEPEIARLRATQSSKLAFNQGLEPLWPLRELAMKQLFGSADLCTARRLIHQAAEQFEAARGSMLPDTRTTAEFLADEFAGRREQALANPAEDTEELLLTALPILFEFLGDKAPPLAVGNLAAAGKRAFEGMVQVLNQPHAASVATRLKKIEQTWNPETDPPLILVRDARRTISPNAKKTREILDRLRIRGAHLAQPSAEVLATLEALRGLHADAQSGNLVHRGDTVATEALKAWFASNLPPVLEDFLEELKPKAAKDHFVSDLLDFLEVHSIVKLEEAAQAIQVPPQQLADYASHHPVQFGYLAGPPPVLFRAVPGRAGDPCEAD
jgi:hypothetical protein